MTSFEQWGVYGVEDYLKSERIASNFVDTYETENNVEARCKVSPKWNPSDDKEKKLEKIITQKWIAMFPEGCEAWAEQRRTPTSLSRYFANRRSGAIFCPCESFGWRRSRRYIPMVGYGK